MRDRVAELHATGASRNAIARELGIGAATVTAIAQDLGISFDRAAAAQATKARVRDAARRRADLMHRFYDQADAVMNRLDLPSHDLAQPSAGDLVRWTARYLPAQDVKALVQAAGAAVDRAVRLEQVDARDGADDVASMLGRMGDALIAAARLDPAAEEVPAAEEGDHA
jgi:hypothetical protein